MGIAYKGKLRAEYNAGNPGHRDEPVGTYKVNLFRNFWSGITGQQESGVECPQCHQMMHQHKHGRHTTYHECSCGYKSKQ